MEGAVSNDATFYANMDHSSELVNSARIVNRLNGLINILHFTISKSRRVCKSVLAADLLFILEGSSVEYTISHTIGDLLGREKYLAT